MKVKKLLNSIFSGPYLFFNKKDSSMELEKVLEGVSLQCHTVTMLLKLYLRQLPAPLFPEQLLRDMEETLSTEIIHNSNPFDSLPLSLVFKETVPEKEKRIAKIASCVSELPLEHRTLLLHLISHFRAVTKKSQKNKMNIQRIATVFKDVLFCTSELIVCIYENRRAILQPSCFYCKKTIPIYEKVVMKDSKICCNSCHSKNETQQN